MEIAQRLALFLSAEASRPFVRGEHDCGLWLADWYIALTGGPDPAAHLRGWYERVSDKRDDLAVLSCVRGVCRALGLARTAGPKLGDIAVIEPAGQPQRIIVGAIRGNDGWIVLAPERGISKLHDDEARLVAAWSMECRQS